MPFCRNCGQDLTTSSSFCPRCGAAVDGGSSSPAVGAGASGASSSVASSPIGRENEFDRLTHDSKVQEFWFKRVIAFVIDSIIVVIAALIVSVIIFVIIGITTAAFFSLYTGSGFSFIPFSVGAIGITGLTGLFYLLYFTVAEAYYQRTIGKGFMNLHVVTTDGSKMNIEKAFLRNLSKIYWLLLLLDLIGGFFVHDVFSGQKFSDHIANTNVTTSK